MILNKNKKKRMTKKVLKNQEQIVKINKYNN